ncbi:MAG: NAD-dependent epimerase/dehydratase family protein [Kiritimatiellia bacterium]
MKRLLDIPEYVDDLRHVAALELPWERLRGKRLLITGGTGQIGSFLIDVLHVLDIGCAVVLLGRDERKARARFQEYWQEDFLKFYEWRSFEQEVPQVREPVDLVLHLASNTHPVSYASDPIGTIAGNVIALNGLLRLAVAKRCARFLFASSNEVYGENRGDVELFDEKYCGYIDCNTLRAGYPESKRCGEALCQAYVRQAALDCVIARLTRTYGPSVLPDDTKAASQFFRNAVRGEPIVLKSDGRQHYSFLHVADSVSGLLTVLLRGEVGGAYNVAEVGNDVTLRELASLIAQAAGREVVFDCPGALEREGFSKVVKARLDGGRLQRLGWRPRYDIASGVAANYRVLRAAAANG